MSRSFKNNSISGKSAFKTFHKSQDAGEYILKKKSVTLFCNPKISRIVTTNSKGKLFRGHSDYLLFNNSSYLKYYEKLDDIYAVKQTLNHALITKLDLENVPVIEGTLGVCPTNIDTKSPSYLTYTIDPSGNLFGNNVCGEYNWQNYITPL